MEVAPNPCLPGAYFPLEEAARRATVLVVYRHTRNGDKPVSCAEMERHCAAASARLALATPLDFTTSYAGWAVSLSTAELSRFHDVADDMARVCGLRLYANDTSQVTFEAGQPVSRLSHEAALLGMALAMDRLNLSWTATLRMPLYTEAFWTLHAGRAYAAAASPDLRAPTARFASTSLLQQSVDLAAQAQKTPAAAALATAATAAAAAPAPAASATNSDGSSVVAVADRAV